MERVRQVLNYLIENRARALVFLGSFLCFLFLLFPFDDLSELVSSQVAKVTDNSIYLRFERLRMSLLPQLGLQMDQVYIESASFPPLSTDKLVITPSISGLIRKRPYGTISANGLFKGKVRLNLASGTRTESGVERHRIELLGENLNLSLLRELIGLPVSLNGQTDLEISNLQVDTAMAEQPDGDIRLLIKNFELPTTNLPTQLGTLTLPELKLGRLEVNGRLAGGRLNITNGYIGQEGDEIYGTFKVNMGLPFQPAPNFLPTLTNYSVELDLLVKRSFQERASLFLSFLDSYKTANPYGAQYKIKLIGNGTHSPPVLK